MAGDTYTDSLDEGETKNGVGEELATERRVAGNSLDEGGENQTDTDTSTGKTDGGRAHTNVLRDLDEGVGHLRRVGAGGLGGDRGGLGESEGRGALHGVEGGLAGDGCDRFFINSCSVSIVVHPLRAIGSFCQLL